MRSYRAAILCLAALSLAGGCRASAPTPPALEAAVLHTVEGLMPSNDRDWSPDQAVLSTALFRDNLVTIHNIRNCQYHTADDYTVEHYDKTFDLDKIRTVDFIVVPFGETPSLAHTMLSFGFEGDEYLGVSVEIRKERDESYSPVSGSMRQYEIMYVVADERDLIGLRAIHRLDDVYLYPVRARPEQVRAMFVDVMQRVNKLAVLPEFYDTMTNNCMINIVQHVNRVSPNRIPMHLGVMLPGLSDRFAYELGILNVEGTFEQARQNARVNRLAYLHRNADDFSARIRR